MSQDSDSFLTALETSRLLSPAVLRQFFQQSPNITATNPSAIAKALVDQKLITSFHAEILLAGRPGPFFFGNYMIIGRFDEGPLSGQFKGRHVTTQHPVSLQFFQGQTVDDLASWQRVEEQVTQLSVFGSRLKSPFVVEFFETIVMPSYRFVVSQRPEGVTLHERLPRKARLPWKDACMIMAQIASAVESLHQQGFSCKSLSPETIWVCKSGFAQFRPNLIPSDPTSSLTPKSANRPPLDSVVDELSDWSRFGSILFRVLYGKPFANSSDAADSEAIQIDSPQSLKQELAKHELPKELIELLIALLFTTSNVKRPTSISAVLCELANRPLKSILIPAESSLADYRKTLTNFVPRRSDAPVEFPKLETGNEGPQPDKQAVSLPAIAPSIANSPNRTLVSPQARKKKWLPLAATMASIWLFCGLLGFGAYQASKRSAPGTSVARQPEQPSQSLAVDKIESKVAVGSNPDSSSTTPVNSKPLTPILVQNLVADDRTRLWQSPTQGPALDLNGLPPSPKIIFVIRPAELMALPEGGLLLKSFGPNFIQLIQRWEEQTAIPLTEIEQIVVSLHSNEEFKYDCYIRCRFAKLMPSKTIIDRWKNPSPQSTDNDNLYYASAGQSHGFVVLKPNSSGNQKDQSSNSDPSESDDSEDVISEFGVGELRLVKGVADAASASGGSIMQSLADRTDCQRHVNILFLRPALFNDEGQAFMAGKWSFLNRELNEILPDEIQGGSLSLHLDLGTFLELQFAQTVDLKGAELQQRLEERFRALRDRTNEYIAAIPPSPYWDRVRLKLNLMAVDAFRSLRWGVEEGEVIANSWLPPMAAHNLIAAMELAVSFSNGTSASPTIAGNSSAGTPKTLDELLATKRDLKVANPPDLNLLLSDLEVEINEEYPGLPFQFRIRLMGPDLQIEGITQNQRPGELNIEQKTLSEILTTIMVSANPAKDISGPADPRCKLVWAIADDPDKAGEKMIVITTRNAANQKNYQLPPAFQVE